MLHQPHAKQGVILLIAVLTSSILLGTGIAIATIAVKQAQLIETASQSLKALYAADAGGECAVYWDADRNAFDPLVSGSITCFGETKSFPAAFTGPWDSSSSATRQFSFNTPSYCIDITVIKSGVPMNTSIEARGRNTCITTARRVERAFRIQY